MGNLTLALAHTLAGDTVTIDGFQEFAFHFMPVTTGSSKSPLLHCNIIRILSPVLDFFSEGHLEHLFNVEGAGGAPLVECGF
jgi:hypothetical protein